MSSQHNLQDILETAHFTGTGKILLNKSSGGHMLGWGTTVPSTASGWSPGALFIDTDAAADSQWYINEGTNASSNFQRYVSGNILLLDSETFTIGTGSDHEIQWDGSRVIAGPPTGFWSGCPDLGYGGSHRNAFTFFDDFLSFEVGNLTSKWTLTTTGGTVKLGNAEAANLFAGGYIDLEAATADEDYVTLMLDDSTVGAGFYISEASTKKLWYETRIQVSSVTSSTIYVGLFSPASDDISVDATGAEAVTDGIYFRTLGGSSPTELDFCVNESGGTEEEASGNISALAANTAITLGFLFDGDDTVTPYVNGTAGTPAAVTDVDFPNDVGLTPGFHIKTVAAGTKSLYVDWVKVVQER